MLLGLAKGDRSINRFGKDAGVDPGYISRLLRGKLKNAPSAMVINKLANAAGTEVSVQDLMAAAGYIDDHAVGGKELQSRPSPQWEIVMEEAARYEISPEIAADLIRSLGLSMERIKKEKP